MHPKGLRKESQLAYCLQEKTTTLPLVSVHSTFS